MKKSAFNRIIIWSIVTVVLIATLVVGIFGVKVLSNNVSEALSNIGGFQIENAELYTDGEATFKASDVNSINANWFDGEIKIVYADTDEVKIEEDYDDPDAPQMCWFLDKGELELYSNREHLSFAELSVDSTPKELTITIPKDKKLNELEINTADAPIYADYIDVVSFEVNSVDSEIKVNKLICNEANVNNVDADIEVYCENVNEVQFNSVSGVSTVKGNFKEIEGNTVSGDINVDITKATTDAEIGTVSGDIKFAVAEDVSGFTVDNESAGATINSEFQTRTHDSEMVYGNGSVSLNVESVGGDVDIVKIK